MREAGQTGLVRSCMREFEERKRGFGGERYDIQW